ncbi:hypothetical protein HDU96_006922, partial [Phlyctochytrium bullatum]
GFLSSVSSFVVLLIMALSPRARTSGNLARTVLLLLLFFADFTNSFFNAISGILRLNNRLTSGPFCNFGGWFGQWSIQSSDLATFSLALVTFVVAQAATNLDNLARRLQQVESFTPYMALAICIIPIFTATTGYLIVGMAPSGSWCWFAKDPRPTATIVRYTLTHGPRILIICTIVGLYSVLFWAFRVRIRQQEEIMSKEMEAEVAAAAASGNKSVDGEARSLDGNADPLQAAYDEERAKRQIRIKANAQRQAIQKLLVYPTAYTLLWIPGLTHRFAEASNQSPEFLAVTGFLQFTTQLIGFANSVIYGYSQFFGKGVGKL